MATFCRLLFPHEPGILTSGESECFVRYDAGFAPNPFGGFLTLATCKPNIRCSACVGDYVIGTGSVKTVGADKLVYAAQITKIISLEEYGEGYIDKRPSEQGEWSQKLGDNIYFKDKGEWKRRPSIYHCKADEMIKDLSGKNVLICERFWYFGRNAICIPDDLKEIIKEPPKQGHKSISDKATIDKFIKWIETQPEGCNGKPEMEGKQGTGCGEEC